MLRFACSILLCFCFAGILAAQSYSVKGLITDKASGKPVNGASVFLSNTSYGSISNAKGEFEIAGIKPGRYDLVVSFIGYESAVRAVSDNDSQHFLSIALVQKTNDLQEVVVGNYIKDGWQKWGRFFLDNLIGTSLNAEGCKLKNTGDVKFRLSKTGKELSAFAAEPLIIENKSLGYTIQYQLEDFTYDFSVHYLYYAGFPLFEEMQGNKNQKNKWTKERRSVYEVSLMHFMRSLYINKLSENGYVLYHLQRLPNTEKQRLQAKSKLYYDTVSKQHTILNYETTLPPDSLLYYQKIMAQKDPIEIILREPVTGDSIAYGADSVTAGLEFRDYLIVRIPARIVPAEYIKANDGVQAGQAVSSVISLPYGIPVMVTANGYFYEGKDLLSEGFWGWWEKLSTMLPLDYSPGGE